MHLTQVCLWEKVLNYEKRFFGLGHVCKLNGLEDFCRVNFTEVVLGDCKRLGGVTVLHRPVREGDREM